MTTIIKRIYNVVVTEWRYEVEEIIIQDDEPMPPPPEEEDIDPRLLN